MTALARGFDVAVFVNPDLRHQPEDVTRLVAAFSDRYTAERIADVLERPLQ